MEQEEIMTLIAERYPECMLADGYGDCIIGVCHQFGAEPKVAYDRGMVIAKLMKEGMNEEEAEEWFGFNIIGAYVGETTPVYIEDLRKS